MQKNGSIENIYLEICPDFHNPDFLKKNKNILIFNHATKKKKTNSQI